MKYLDQKHHRLVFIEEEANSQFWENKWNNYELTTLVKSSANNRSLVKTMQRYLEKGSKILEGGCGFGSKVYCMHANGYDAYGVDFATSTVKKINTTFPELKVSVADVRNLPFEDNYFDGYWSVGVIEHFYEGFSNISNEMNRVLKQKGVLFLSFPSMSVIRKLKAKLGFYPYWNGNDKKKFYQYALDVNTVQNEFENLGFTLLAKKSFDGLKGFKDEIRLARTLLQSLYDSQSFLARVFRYGFNLILSSAFGHCSLLILRKN